MALALAEALKEGAPGETTDADEEPQHQQHQRQQEEQQQGRGSSEAVENLETAKATPTAAVAASTAVAAGRKAEVKRETKTQQPHRSPSYHEILKTIPGGPSSVLSQLLKLPLPAPPSAPQLLETAFKPADTKVSPQPYTLKPEPPPLESEPSTLISTPHRLERLRWLRLCRTFFPAPSFFSASLSAF